MLSKYINDGCSVELVPIDIDGLSNVYQIYKMWSEPHCRGKGHANRLARHVCDEADKHGIVLMTFPMPFNEHPDTDIKIDAKGMSKQRLIKWYESMSFNILQDNPTLMARQPKGFQQNLSEITGTLPTEEEHEI